MIVNGKVEHIEGREAKFFELCEPSRSHLRGIQKPVSTGEKSAAPGLLKYQSWKLQVSEITLEEGKSLVTSLNLSETNDITYDALEICQNLLNIKSSCLKFDHFSKSLKVNWEYMKTPGEVIIPL
jgi:hypothetical protein